MRSAQFQPALQAEVDYKLDSLNTSAVINLENSYRYIIDYFSGRRFLGDHNIVLSLGRGKRGVPRSPLADPCCRSVE